jgi:hypothetical protein
MAYVLNNDVKTVTLLAARHTEWHREKAAK